MCLWDQISWELIFVPIRSHSFPQAPQTCRKSARTCCPSFGDATPTLCVYRIRDDGGDQYVRFAPLDETLEGQGLLLEGLGPGGYAVAVELSGDSWTKRPVLARREISLDAGEGAPRRREGAGGGNNVLVHCTMGVSRSVSICIAYMMHMTQNFDYELLFKRVKRKRGARRARARARRRVHRVRTPAYADGRG